MNTYRGKDIEKMSREELVEAVRELGKLLRRAEQELRGPPDFVLRRKSSKHYTGLP